MKQHLSLLTEIPEKINLIRLKPERFIKILDKMLPLTAMSSSQGVK